MMITKVTFNVEPLGKFYQTVPEIEVMINKGTRARLSINE